MHINRLRLLGFKSFVEPADLVIHKGLTGVVGPNGCGKSNLLEALRWVMGETSHKSMRAAAMDDVIFSGTTARPARNAAEVTLFLDNSERRAPAEFNDRDTLEITRRIEREAGSAYRINGREARARDIKILFEDAATGARSPALVRQGQIGEIVNAKPEQRRRILEDAAGVAGLHSRRHEAELRLKAAEGNLARLGDILGQLNTQIESLKRQARHAKRYKELSVEIRRTEALALHVAWTQAQGDVDREEQALRVALTALAAATQADSEATRAEADAAIPLQGLRDEEAVRSAVLARLRIAGETFEREAERHAARQRELAGRVAQLAADREREAAHAEEAGEQAEALVFELDAIEQAASGAADVEAGFAGAIDEAEGVLSRQEAVLRAATAAVVEARTRRRGLETALAERRAGVERLKRRKSEVAAQLAAIAARAPDARKLAEMQTEGRRLAGELVSLDAAMDEAGPITQTTAASVREHRTLAEAAVIALRQIETERSTLAKLLLPSVDATDAGESLLDQVIVARGYETAFGAALGDDLDASLSEDRPVHWRHVDPAATDAALPEGVEPLLAHVEGPAALTRRLAQIGVVAPELGRRLQPRLAPGQRLVSRSGDVWRWDGFVAAGDAPTAAAQRLVERNRLAGLAAEEAATRVSAEAARHALAVAQQAHEAAERHEAALRVSARDVQTALSRLREQTTAMERAARETEVLLSAARDSEGEIDEALFDAVAALEDAESELADVPPADDLMAEQQTAEAATTEARETLARLSAELAGHQRERKLKSDRMAQITAERQRLMSRQQSAHQQLATLDARSTEAKAELDGLADLPERIARERQKLQDEIADAERQRQQAADALALAETRLREAAQALRAAQSAIATHREDKARAEARLEAARARRAEEARRIREALDVAPEACLPLAEREAGATLPPQAEVERQLSRLKTDRDRLGGVNLQADDELQVLAQQHSGLDRERLDVEDAIAKLRGGIAQLNREARKRLGEAFQTVDAHFRRLFGILFGGGEARLEMIESEDPLQGGLEIIAKPPGKKPVTLSLLSGGEQTLTALSLIFAVFLTNPSPICVLDEVDAPLDDANVDRFCTMMERMAEETETRFLVITHHPMTMARMNRLFGVTMAEKGVSQLVSVDLATAERFLEAS